MSQTIQVVDAKTRVISPQSAVSVPVDFTSAALQVIQGTPGRIFGVLVTAALTGTVTIYDNASAAAGTIIGYVPASTAVGTFVPFLSGGVPAAQGITAQASATGGKLTAFVS